jgi:hypothetical protein
VWKNQIVLVLIVITSWSITHRHVRHVLRAKFYKPGLRSLMCLACFAGAEHQGCCQAPAAVPVRPGYRRPVQRGYFCWAHDTAEGV